MDADLALLAILRIAGKYEKNLRTGELSFAQAMLSCLVGEVIDGSRYAALLALLVERNHVTKDGENYVVTTAGKGLIDAIAASRLGPNDMKLIERTVAKFAAAEPAEQQELIDGLLEDVNRKVEQSGSKVSELPGTRLISNSAILASAFVTKKLYALDFRFPPLTPMDDAGKFRTVGNMLHNAEREYHTVLAFKLTGSETFRVYSHRSDISLGFQELILSPEDRRDIAPGAAEVPLERLSERMITTRFEELHWRSTGPGLRFVNYANADHQVTRVGRITEYRAVRLVVERLSGNQILVWIEPDTKVIFTLYDFVQRLEAEGRTIDDISSILHGLKLRVLPSAAEAEFLGIELELDVTKETIPGTGETYSKFWKRVHNIGPLTPLQPMLRVRLGEKEFHYPAETVYVDRRSLEETIGSYEDRRPRSLTPYQRIEEAKQLLGSLFPNDRLLTENLCELSLLEAFPSWERLKNLKYCQRIVKIQPPTLEFAGGATSPDPRTIFTAGPFSGRKDLHLSYIFAPADMAEAEVTAMVQELRGAYDRLGFGQLVTPTGRYIFRFTPGVKANLETIVQSTPTFTQPNQLAIVILPEEASRFYFEFKRLLPTLRHIPIQSVRRDTVARLVRGHYGVTKHLCMQFYTKLIQEHEAPWILSQPADGVNQTLYVGIGFSMEPTDAVKQAKCATSLCDARGRELRWRVFSTPFMQRLIDREWFSSVLDNIRTNVKSTHKRIVVYRMGDTYQAEREAVQEAYHNASSQLSQSLNFVSVLDDHRRIIVDANGYRNPEAGLAVIFEGNEALLTAAETTQGTVRPVRLVQNVGKDPMELVAREYFDQTFLVWSAPNTTSKYPIVSVIARNIAEMVKELRTDEPIKSLPL